MSEAVIVLAHGVRSGPGKRWRACRVRFWPYHNSRPAGSSRCGWPCGWEA